MFCAKLTLCGNLERVGIEGDDLQRRREKEALTVNIFGAQQPTHIKPFMHNYRRKSFFSEI